MIPPVCPLATSSYYSRAKNQDFLKPAAVGGDIDLGVTLVKWKCHINYDVYYFIASTSYVEGRHVIFLCVIDEGVLVDGGSLGSFLFFGQNFRLFNISV